MIPIDADAPSHRPDWRRILSRASAAAAVVLAGLVQAGSYPQADVALGSRALVAAVDSRLGGVCARELASAVAGGAGREWLLTRLGDFAAALDVPTIADQQWTHALELADRRGDAHASLQLSQALGRSALALGDYERAFTLAQRITTLGQRLGDASAQGQAQNILGIIERRRGHLDLAAAHQQRARELFDSAGNRAGAARALTDLGTVLRDRGEVAGALEAHLDALAMSPDRIDHVYRNLGLLYRDVDDATASRNYFERALQAARERGAPPSAYATVIGSYASLLNELGEYPGAQAAATEALAIDSALDDLPHQGLEHLELGRALLGLGQPQAAVGHFEQALQLGRRVHQREIVARALLHLGEAALGERDLPRARGLIESAIGELANTRLRPQLADAYALRQQLASDEGKAREALDYANQAMRLREELSGIRTSRQLAVLEARHERSDAEHRVALLAKDNELQAARIERQALVRDIVLLALAGLLLAFAALVWRHRGVRRLNRELAARNLEIDQQRNALDRANATLRAQASDLLRAATTDALTQVANRRHLLDCLGQRVADALAHSRPLALMLIDFDHFKRINDQHGHLFGDEVLVTGVATLREALGADHVVGRYGGEEFVAIVSDDSEQEVLVMAERLRMRVESSLARLAPSLNGLATISIGVAFLADLGPRADAAMLLEAADRAVYLAKREGRNCVRRYHP